MSFRKLGGLAGLAFVVLIVANVILLGDQPSGDDSVEEIRRYLADHGGRNDAALVVGLFVVPVAVLFFAGLFDRLRPSDRAHNESWSVAMVLAAALLGATATGGDVVFGTLTLREGDLDSGVLRALWDLQYIAYTATAATMATFVLSVAIPVLRHRIWPAWYGWLSVLVAAIAVASVFGVMSVDSWLSYIGLPALVIWALVTSILLLARPADDGAVLVTVEGSETVA